MPRNEQMVDLRDFRGVNRRDGAEKADIREFLTIQNWFRNEKGIFEKRYGTTDDLAAADIPGAHRITKMIRHTANPCPRATLYHCTPTPTPLTSPDGTELVLQEVVAGDGTIFDACTAASLELRFCHSYIGMGVESGWDTRLRAGFDPSDGVAAWNQPGLQTITLGSATNKVNVSHPGSFPADVRAVNVFMSIGNSGDANQRNLVFVGTLKSNLEVLLVDVSIPSPSPDPIDNTFTEANFEIDAAQGGNLPPGQYYVGLAWVVDGQATDHVFELARYTRVKIAKPVNLSGFNKTIEINHWEAGGVSSDGATHVYAFLGTKPIGEGPMTFVGAFRLKSSGGGVSLSIADLPMNSNACTRGDVFTHVPIMREVAAEYRSAFIIKRDPDRTPVISEVFPSRSSMFFGQGSDDVYPYITLRSDRDRGFNNAALPAHPNLVIPSLAYFNGLTYLANGRDFYVTDGIGITMMVAKSGCVIPKAPYRIISFKSQLVAFTIGEQGVALASNALAGNNWSDGGSGTAIRFIVLGDPFEARGSAFGIFSYTTGTDGPRTFLVSFKKNSCWSATQIPDASAGINAQADQMSGKVGCIAWQTIQPSKMGLLFLGSDGDVYMIRGSGEPYPFGGRVKKLLEHLVQNDALMELCSATVHGDFYKLSYPSSLSSTTADAQLWADLRTQDGDPICWDGPHTGLEIACQLVLDKEGDTEKRIAGLANASVSARLDDPSVSQDRGAPIVSVLEWTRRNMRSEWNFKKWKGVFLEAFFDTLYNHTLLIEGFSDTEYTQVNEVVGVADVNGEALWRSIVAYFPDDNMVGKDFRFRITHQNNAKFTISAIGIPFKPERRLTI